MHPATTFELIGAGAFGALIGWYLFYINRHRTTTVRLTDLVTVIGAVGGGAILKLFPAGTSMFGAYGIGLFAGFFGYFGVLAWLVRKSSNFTIDYFIDGRFKRPAADEGQTSAAMGGEVNGSQVIR